MLKSFYLPRSYNPQKGKGAINDLNNLLNDVGVSFSVSKKDNGQKLFISVDEDKLEKIKKSEGGRPVIHRFDFEEVQRMKEDGMTNKQIYEALGMSKALFYLRMKEHKGKSL